ncbi:MAG TPA: PAS domain-containing protein [Anaeromyxobacter sp.]|nr:PAS domain-containing protein [Anaeromyxobacter sp.]
MPPRPAALLPQHASKTAATPARPESRAELLARFPEENPDPVLRVSAELRIVYANPAAAEVFRGLGVRAHGPAPAALADPARAALADGARRRVELACGEAVFEVSVVPVGREVNLYAHDVTARKRAEDALRASEAALDAFFACSPGILNLLDEELRYVKTDATTPTYFGLARETLAGRSARELVPEFLERFGPMIARVLETGEPTRNVEVHGPVRTRPGEIAYWRASYFPVPLPGGRRGLGVMGVEITDLRKADQALRESAERFETLADNIAQLAWMADEQGSVFWYNRRWFEYTGTTLQEMQGWGWRGVHHPDHVGRVVAEFDRCVRTGEAWEDTFPLRGRDGAYRWFLSRALPIRDPSGRVVRWFGTNTDVTVQREAEQALRDADQRKNDFLAVLSHELRGPIAPIRNGIYLLDKLPADSVQAARARQVIARQTEHLARLVDDLLDATRISRGKVQLQREVVDLRDLVRRACDDHRSGFEQARIELSLHFPAAPVRADVDPTRIAQVVGNLLGNALKFTPAGGAVTVRLRAVNGRAELRVHDTGVGIDRDQLGRMFEPFAQEERNLARSRGGLGLGLALSRGLAQLHGGTITARSDGPGKGAEFVMSLSLAVGTPEAASTGWTADARARRRVLLVDDNADAARMLADVLELLGHEVSVAADGTTGIALARELRPDVVICDLGLPDVDGYEVARTLRSDEALRSTRLIALSGYGQPEDKQRAREAGFEAHLTRPAPLDALAAALR